MFTLKVVSIAEDPRQSVQCWFPGVDFVSVIGRYGWDQLDEKIAELETLYVPDTYLADRVPVVSLILAEIHGNHRHMLVDQAYLLSAEGKTVDRIAG